MIVTTQLLFWPLFVAVQRVASSHPGVTRVLPVEGGLTDFRIGPAASPAPSSAPPQQQQQAPPAPPPQNAPPLPGPLREESSPAESAVRFPNNLDVDLGSPLVRGVPMYPAWSNNAPGYISHPVQQNTGNVPVQTDPAIDNTASASGNAYRQGEYIEDDTNPPGLIGGQTDSEVTFRDEHHPSIFIKNPTFNSVAIGFMVYLILLTVLQNSMLNWSQKGSLLTLGATTQRTQREVVDRATPVPHPAVSTTPAARGVDVDDRARIQPEAEYPEENRAPVSVAAILNDDHDTSKFRTAGPRALAPNITQSDHVTKINDTRKERHK